MLGREERGQLDAVADAAQHVDGAAALGVEAGLIGEQADAEMASVARGSFLERRKVGGFEDVNAGESGSWQFRGVAVMVFEGMESNWGAPL